ncbi:MULTISPECIES: helix-turn-helix domain-containing protein [Prevotellaceae]|jgi:uncharacterized protein YjcR|uniref:helix-turn-helix domain-containing protein n=1 Tax=Leyella stercorea TaxID=363265 RepID=UPI00242C66B9|nr:MULTISPECIES: helix-turn-helix domain-containing protein [Prevotellaceae]
MVKSNINKKDIAKDLYLKGGCTQEEIAAKVGTTRQTVSRWAREGKWEELRASFTISTENILAGMIRQVSEIQNQANARKEGERSFTSKEADTVVKITSAIKKLQNDAGITDIVNVGIKFTNWLRGIDIEKAKEYNELWDLFIKDQLK